MTSQEKLDAILRTGIAHMTTYGEHVRSTDGIQYRVILDVGPDFAGYGCEHTFGEALRRALDALGRDMTERRAPAKKHREILRVLGREGT